MQYEVAGRVRRSWVMKGRNVSRETAESGSTVKVVCYIGVEQISASVNGTLSEGAKPTLCNSLNVLVSKARYEQTSATFRAM